MTDTPSPTATILTVHAFLRRCREAVAARDWVSPTMDEITALSQILCDIETAPQTAEAGEAAEVLAKDIWERLAPEGLKDCQPPAWIAEQIASHFPPPEAAPVALERDRLWCEALVRAQELPDDIRMVERVTRIFNEIRPDKAMIAASQTGETK